MKRIVGIVLSFTLTALIAGFFSRYDVDPHHDGIFLKPAIDMMEGQQLFKDTFSIYGPGASVFHFAILTIFGESLIYLKLGTSFVYGLIAGILFYVSSTLLPLFLAFGVVLLWVAMAPYYEPGITFFIWPSVYALLFQLLAVAFIYAWEKKRSPFLLTLSGLNVAVTVWMRIPVGVLLYIAIVAYFVLQKKIQNRSTFIFHFSFLIFNMSALLFLWFYGVLSDWFFQSVVFVSWWHSAVLGGRIFPLVFLEKMLPLSFGPISVWVLLPASAIFVLWKKVKNAQIILLALVGLVSWVQYYPMNDIHHIYWAITPLFPVLFWVAYSSSNKSRSVMVVLCLLSVLFLPDIYNRARMIRHKLRGEYVKIQTPPVLRGMLVRPDLYDKIKKQYLDIAMFEKKYPDGLVFTTGPDVLFATFAQNKTNCHPFTSNWGWEVYNKTFDTKYKGAIQQCRKEYGKRLFILKKKDSTCFCSD